MRNEWGAATAAQTELRASRKAPLRALTEEATLSLAFEQSGLPGKVFTASPRPRAPNETSVQ